MVYDIFDKQIWDWLNKALVKFKEGRMNFDTQFYKLSMVKADRPKDFSESRSFLEDGELLESTLLGWLYLCGLVSPMASFGQKVFIEAKGVVRNGFLELFRSLPFDVGVCDYEGDDTKIQSYHTLILHLFDLYKSATGAVIPPLPIEGLGALHAAYLLKVSNFLLTQTGHSYAHWRVQDLKEAGIKIKHFYTKNSDYKEISINEAATKSFLSHSTSKYCKHITRDAVNSYDGYVFYRYRDNNVKCDFCANTLVKLPA